MSIVNFLYELKKIGISIQLEDRNLKVKIASGKIPPDIIAQLKERKEEIIRFLDMAQEVRAVNEKYIEIEPVEKREYYSLSSAQKRLYFVQQVDLNMIAYNIPYDLTLGNDVDPNRLEATLKTLIQRHESLRTSFEMIDEEPVQRIHESAEFSIEYHDLTKEESGNHSAIDGLIRSFYRPFDLSKAPLLRSLLIRLPDGNHRWMLDIHHIVSDGTSLRILNDEFLTLYHGGKLKPLRIQYKDFSSWQNQLFDDEKNKTLEDYWLRIFQGEIPRLNLTPDYPRPGVFTFQGACYNFKLEGETSARFKALAQAHGGTLYMNILAVLNTIFYKYTGQTDMIIGSGIAGRPHADLQQIIGMFINSLAIRNYPQGHKIYESFLDEVIQSSIQGFENQDMQFEKLVEKLAIERDPSRNPLFDIMLTVQNYSVNESQEKLTSDINEDHEASKTTTKFDMTFSVYENGPDILIGLDYYTAIFKRETIERFVRHFQKIVNDVVSNPAIALDDIDLMTEREREDVLYRFNDTAIEYPKDKTIAELFEEQVNRVPDRISVIETLRATSIQITYRELDNQANHLACILKGKGVQSDTIVAIQIERSIEMMIGIVGILKAGGAYLPIDPDYPQERADYMLKDSGAAVLINTDTFNEFRRGAPACAPDPVKILGQTHGSAPTNLAYIIYTSGSTGKPKGVMVDHPNVVRLVKGDNVVKLSQETRILQTGAPVFDATTFELWGSLLNGGQLYLVPNEVILNGERLSRALVKEDINTLWLSSPLFNRLVAQNERIFSTLMYLIVGGDVLSPVSINTVRRTFPNLNIINGYGPTENTTFSTFFLIDQDYEDHIPIGKPIKNSTAYILDKQLRPQPVGICGELVLGGDGIARGYLNNPEMTFEKFTGYQLPVAGSLHLSNNKNFCGGPGGGFYKKSPLVYKTGDLARWLDDGNIEFLGRIDTQVKIRGFRVEPGEIEAGILQSGEGTIKSVIVIDREDKHGDKYLCAYIVPDQFDPSNIDLLNQAAGKIKHRLSSILPAYMIPSHFTILEKIPLNANGKVDRNALPDPVMVASTAYVAPENEIEEKLVEIWADVLGLEKETLGVNDNFFDKGGHSLKAAIMIAKISKEFNVNIPLGKIFETPTIRDIALILSVVQWTNESIDESSNSEMTNETEIDDMVI
ncbi:MAG: amino acid adenylation domain-containing protein [Candidatus Omnitrophota bacterium]